MPFRNKSFFHKITHVFVCITILFLGIITLSFFPIAAYAQQALPTIVTPTLYCLGSCPTTAPGATTPTIATGTTPTTETTTIVPTDALSTTTAPTEDPCLSGTVSIQHWHHHKKKSNGSIGNGMSGLLELLKQLMELIKQLLGGGTPTLPEQPITPEPTNAADPTTAPENPCPTTQPTTGTEQPTLAPVATVPPTAAPTTAPGNGTIAPTAGGTGTTQTVNITFYGSYDNDPKGSLAIAHPVIHQQAGGTGTYADPLTFASPAGDGEYAFGTIIYVPKVQKYFIREDECAVSWTAPNGCGAVTMVDLYIGNPSGDISVLDCEGALTTGTGPIIVNPPATLTYDPMPIWTEATRTCMTAHE